MGIHYLENKIMPLENNICIAGLDMPLSAGGPAVPLCIPENILSSARTYDIKFRFFNVPEISCIKLQKTED